MEHIDTVAVLRSILILGHLLAFALAAAAIAFADFAIFAGRGVDASMLAKAARAVTLALAVLWATGLAVVWLDTHFALAALVAKPKLLAKVSVVVLLTLNGYALNRLAFPLFTAALGEPRRATLLPVVLGAVSTSTWLFAAFVGVARGLEGALGYTGFMLLYVLVLAIGIAVALRFVWPRLASRMVPLLADYAPSQSGALSQPSLA